MNEKPKIIIVGSGIASTQLAAICERYPTVEIISPEQVQEKGYSFSSAPSIPIKASPLLAMHGIFNAPETRKQRRKREREAKKFNK